MTLSPAHHLRRLGLVLLLGLVALPSLTQAQQSQQQNNQPSERAAEDLQKLQPFIDIKNWNGAINLLNGILRYAAPNSYDQAMANDILWKIYMQKGDYTQAIEPMEKAYALGENFKYFDEKSQLERIYYLAQLFYQEAGNTKTPAVQQQYYIKASNYMETWLKRTPKATEDGRLFYASLLYNRALLNPEHVDTNLLAKAQEQAYEGLLGDLHPKESFYVILVATLQQQGKTEESAKYLELLVKEYPSKASYWQQLMGTYANLAAEEKNPEKALDFNLRAIVTIERAQALGFMNTPKDNYNLVGIYFNIGQFGKATQLLYKGLKDGTIDQDIKKWELLSYSYQQVNQEFQAIDVLKEAAKRFPTSGQLEYQIAQIYYSLDKVNDAYDHLKLAIGKGNLEKPGSVYYFQAYLCFELQKYEEALTAIDKAAGFEDARDTQLPRLKQAIQDALKEREAAKGQK